MTNQLVNLINSIILERGIPKYLEKWVPLKESDLNKDNQNFLKIILLKLKNYHKHCNILTPSIQTQFIDSSFRKAPDFFWDKNLKIGRINYYHFYSSNNKSLNNQDELSMIDLVEKKLNLWNSKEMNGLIIDLRYHKGGNFYPFIKSLNNILGNTTIFGIDKNIVKKNEKKWITNSNNELEVNNFKTSKLKFNKPIAIIINKKTKSSGEFSAAIFKGRKNVKFFGERTAGFLSMNSNVTINKKIVLTFPTNLITTVDNNFMDSEFIEPDVKTNKPITDAKLWIKN